MDTRTGKIYDSVQDGIDELLLKRIDEEKAKSRIVPLSEEQYTAYIGMNRAERRRLYREEMKKAKRKKN